MRVGDRVIYKGEVYTITRKATGVDMYEIAKPHRSHHQLFYTNIIDGLYASDLKLTTEVVK